MHLALRFNLSYGDRQGAEIRQCAEVELRLSRWLLCTCGSSDASVHHAARSSLTIGLSFLMLS